MILISNNPLTEEWTTELTGPVRVAVAGDALAVLTRARDYVHRKWRFLADPGAGRDKHRRNPYLTLWLSGPEASLHMPSLEQMEGLMLQEKRSVQTGFPEDWRGDFQRLDADLAVGVFLALQEGSESID